MLQGEGEHSAIFLTFIKLQVVIKTFVLPIFEWLFFTGFTVQEPILNHLGVIYFTSHTTEIEIYLDLKH